MTDPRKATAAMPTCSRSRENLPVTSKGRAVYPLKPR